MEDYKDIIFRIGINLAEIEEKIVVPLSEAANRYRLTAEAICKAIIVGHGSKPQGLLDKLIADALKFVEAEEISRDAGIFKTEIRYLQNIGNTYSHDGAGSHFSENQPQEKAFDSLVKVIRIAFFGQSDLDAPLLPSLIEERIPERMLGRIKFENPRADEVVRLCFPKNRVETKIKRSDHTNRLVYDYVVVDLLGGLSKGMIFIRSKTAIEKTLTEFQASIGNDFPDALDIITPRAYRSDGGEIDRKKSIVDIIKNVSFASFNPKVNVRYFDDFVWESCLPEEFRVSDSTIKKNIYFINQMLEIEGNDTPHAIHSSTSEYIAKVMKSSHNYSPVQIVIGPAGIGKTTFCDDMVNYINSQVRKRVILLSSTDFREVSNSRPIESVSDLYRIAAENGLMNEKDSIESHNFEINLACGNFVLIIDGFDELESHLGSSLNFDKFMRSLSELEECFRKVLVILTVRDYEIERFKRIKQTSICRLQGFSSEDTELYFSSRLVDRKKISEARALLRAFNETVEQDRATTIPLYASLICDYLTEDQAAEGFSLESTAGSAQFFSGGQPLDTLVKKIVDREIAKQSLGNIGPDDFFDIIIEIIRAPQNTITKGALLDYINACGSDPSKINPVNFLRNPFLVLDKELVSFKYDSLTYFFKSRLLARKIKDGIFSESPSIDFMSEFYHGEGPLYDEIRAVLPVLTHGENQNTKTWFMSLSQYGQRQPDSKLPWRKAMSAFLYWALERKADKTDRSERLSLFFNGNVWRGLSIYGRFYPLDLRGIIVDGGHIENYENIQDCTTTPNEEVFFSTSVIFDDRSIPEKLDSSIFSSDCIFSQNLSTSFHAKKMADENSQNTIRDNIYKILKVGFRANHFSWKSKDIYKSVTVLGKFSLSSYLDILTSQGVLNLESSHTGSESGYKVSDEWALDARKLVEEKNVTNRMRSLICILLK